MRDVSEVFGRQMEEDASPVSKEDVAQVLRRRFFSPESIRDQGSFRPHVAATVGSIAALDEQTAKERAAAEQRYLDSYPFHPELTGVFYTRWTQLDGFQRTRGILRTFAIALRDAERWDTSPLIGPNVFLNEPGTNDLAEAASELASFASVDTDGGAHQQWRADPGRRVGQSACNPVRRRPPSPPGVGTGSGSRVPELSADRAESVDAGADGTARRRRSPTG